MDGGCAYPICGDMENAGGFEKLDAWQHARLMTRHVYELTSTGPFSRDFALRDQIRRCAMSVMANIAEGFERDGNREFIQFLSIAKGSCGEVRSHLYVALDAQYISVSQFADVNTKAESTARLIGGLLRYLKTSRRRGHKYE